MRTRLWLCARSSMTLIASVLLVVAVSTPITNAYTPESPEVKQIVDRGILFLESNAADDSRMGAMALVGMVMLKHGKKPDHPRVAEAVKEIQKRLRDYDPAKLNSDIYSTGLAAIFLITLDPSQYSSEIECLIQSLQIRQKDHGGWGYPERHTGDTSMTQYGVLSAWEAKQAGFNVPVESIERVATWLLRTQDPSGAFGYQGRISSSFAPVAQDGVRHSMAAAGLGSVYICADMLGFVVRQEEVDDGLPPALKEIKQKEPADDVKKLETRIDARLFRETQARGNRWFAEKYKIDPDQWTYYYMYALERYMAFRDLAEGKVGKRAEKEPAWYNDGVRFLTKTQQEDGSWVGKAKPTPDTSFALLFLLRSSKKSIDKARNFGDGTMVGGRGLPKETTRVEVRMGSVVAKPLLGPAEQLLAVLESRENPDYHKAVDLLAELPTQEAAKIVGKHKEKLRRLAADRDPEARMAAVRALGRTRDFDNAPTLIYALTDPDRTVVIEARDALRRLARKPVGFGLPQKWNESDRRTAIRAWKQWYLAVRPDTEFEN